MDDPRIEIAEQLFAAWSSGDADAPAAVHGPGRRALRHRRRRAPGLAGHPGVLRQGIERWPDLALVPDEYWVNDGGVALRWVMTATVPDESTRAPRPRASSGAPRA